MSIRKKSAFHTSGPDQPKRVTNNRSYVFSERLLWFAFFSKNFKKEKQANCFSEALAGIKKDAQIGRLSAGGFSGFYPTVLLQFGEFQGLDGFIFRNKFCQESTGGVPLSVLPFYVLFTMGWAKLNFIYLFA